MSQMTGAQMVVKALKDQGVDTVFGYPGGAVLPIYDEIFQQNDIRHILVRRPGGHKCCDRNDRRFDGFDPHDRSHRSGSHIHDRK